MTRREIDVEGWSKYRLDLHHFDWMGEDVTRVFCTSGQGNHLPTVMEVHNILRAVQALSRPQRSMDSGEGLALLSLAAVGSGTSLWDGSVHHVLDMHVWRQPLSWRAMGRRCRDAAVVLRHTYIGGTLDVAESCWLFVAVSLKLDLPDCVDRKFVSSQAVWRDVIDCQWRAAWATAQHWITSGSFHCWQTLNGPTNRV